MKLSRRKLFGGIAVLPLLSTRVEAEFRIEWFGADRRKSERPLFCQPGDRQALVHAGRFGAGDGDLVAE